MKKHILTCLSIIFIAFHGKSQSAIAAANTQPVRVQIHKNVELLGFVYFVGYEGQQIENESDPARRQQHLEQYAYGYNLYQTYKTYQDNKHLTYAINSVLNYDLWLDDLITLLIQLDDFPNAAFKDDIQVQDYLEFSPARDPAEARKNAALFIEALNKLYTEVNFDQYLAQNRKKYDNVLAQVNSRLPSEKFIPAMEKFYGQKFHSYTLVPSLTIPASMGFGVKYTSGRKTRIYNVFGAFDKQSFKDETRLDMGFGNERRIRELSTHEFGHSFVNPVIDQMPEELITQTEKLYEAIKDDMTRQGYPKWKYCIYEHFVRAGEILIARNLGNTRDAEDLQKHYIEDRKFIYLPVIIEQLTHYSSNKNISYKDAVKQAMEKLKTKASEI